MESLWKDFKKWRYNRRFSGFSEQVMEKDCIDAVYVDSTPHETQASIRDMIDAYIEGELYTADHSYSAPGLYVDTENRIARQVLDRFDEMDQVIQQHPGLELDLDRESPSWGELKDRVVQDIRTVPDAVRGVANNDISVGDIGTEIAATARYIWDQAPKPGDAYHIRHVDYDMVSTIMENEDAAYAYHDLLRTAAYVDSLIADAADVEQQPTMLYMTADRTGELAHTDHVSLGLNLNSGEAYTLIDQLQDGYLSEPAFNSLVHSILHEKAHGVHGSNHATADHGTAFYDIVQDLEEQYTQYTTAHGIDPQDDINAYLTDQRRADMDDTPMEEFADLTDEYQSVLPW
jgi:hypothetical protein